MTKLFLASVCCSLFLSAAVAQDAPLAGDWKTLKYAALKPLVVPKVDEFTLPNGMRVLLLESHELPLVSGIGLIRTGNLFDPKDKVGLASVTGSVLRSGGTLSKTGDQIDEELENIAASVETNIGESTGTITFSCLKDNLAEVLSVFVDVLTRPEFRQDKIDLTKQQLMSEISRRNDDPGEIAQREYADILYGRDNSYGWSEEIGTVARVERGDIQGFYRRYFFPANVMLAVEGDFNSAEMKSQLEKLFLDWTVKQTSVPPFPKVRFDYKPGTYLAAKEDVTQTTFVIAQPGGEFNDPDYPALEVMSDILGGGFNSRLFRRLRTQLGYLYEVNAGWGAHYDHPGLFSIYGSARSNKTIQSIQAAREEVDRIRQGLVGEEELREAKDTTLNGFVFHFDTPGKTITRLLTYAYYGYPKDFIFGYQKALAAVTREDIQRVARKYLDPAKFIVVAVGNPKDFGDSLDKLGSKAMPIDLTIPGAAASGGAGQ